MPLSFPGAYERCNGLDDDCDGQPDQGWEQDEDGDGALRCEDCDDQRPDRYPEAPDAEGDGFDANCDGTDGEGATLPAPLRVGVSELRTTGLALAGGDVDGDGCAELLIGEPGGWANTEPAHDSAALALGCFPWQDALPSVTSEHSYMGYNVDLAAGLVVVHEAGWRFPRGRLLVYNPATFGPEANPLLEVLGGGLSGRAVNAVAVLGEPAQWLLVGRIAGGEVLSEFYLLDANRKKSPNGEIQAADPPSP